MPALDLGSLLVRIEAESNVLRLARTPLAQFGIPQRRLLGATILPEQTVTENAFREEKIQYRSVIANHGTRYSPVQIKGSAMVGYVDVTLYHSDIGAMLTSREYDYLMSYLRSGATMEAMASIIRFVDLQLVRPLLDRNEKDRWDVIVTGALTLSGDNGYAETISYPNPSGHRAAAGGTWSSDAYDPFDDIYAMQLLLAGKGMTLSRLITSQNVINILAGNDKVKTRTNYITINTSGQVTAQQGRTSLEAINAALSRDGLPSFELYDLQYRTQTGTARFMPNDVVVGIAATGRDQNLDLGDRIEILPNTLGYMAIGTPAGQPNPGRALLLQAFRDKPPRVDGQSWQAAGVVVTEPEGMFVINSIA
jgi:hypothetical protein